MLVPIWHVTPDPPRQRRQEKERKAGAPTQADGEDPDIAGIKLGPQPLAEWQLDEET